MEPHVSKTSPVMDCLAMGGTPLVELQTDASGVSVATFQSSCSAGCGDILFGETDDGQRATHRNGFWVWGRQWSDSTGRRRSSTTTTTGRCSLTPPTSPWNGSRRLILSMSHRADPWYLALQYNTAHDPIMPTSAADDRTHGGQTASTPHRWTAAASQASRPCFHT